MLQKEVLNKFIHLFDRNGYVLNFNTTQFDNFTNDSVKIKIVEKYNMSKGKSLNAFLNDKTIDDYLKVKLLRDLFNYYEFNYKIEYDVNYDGKEKCYYASYNDEKSNLYYFCKKNIDLLICEDTIINEMTNNLKEEFSNSYISKQIECMRKNIIDNPTLSIGLAKELIESCCKTILERSNISYNKNETITNLYKKIVENVDLIPSNVLRDKSSFESFDKLLNVIKSIPFSVNEIRNSYGTGHGKSESFSELDSECAKLVVGCAVLFVNYIWHRFTQVNLKCKVH